MSFCEHCQGQRFDRAQVLRTLRETQRVLRRSAASKIAEQTLAIAIDTIRKMAIPHLEVEEEEPASQSVH
jgi:adenylate kinase